MEKPPCSALDSFATPLPFMTLSLKVASGLVKLAYPCSLDEDYKLHILLVNFWNWRRLSVGINQEPRDGFSVTVVPLWCRIGRHNPHLARLNPWVLALQQ